MKKFSARRLLRVLPYSGPKPPVEHSRILLDAKHRMPGVMFFRENKTAQPI